VKKQGVQETATTPDKITVPKPTGTMTTHNGLEMYISGHPSPNVVIVLPEVWGIASGRLRHIADLLASRGFFAILPKVQPGSPHGGWENDGYGAPIDDGFFPWIGAELNWEKTKPRIEAVLAYAKSQGAKKIGLIGFCWGSWVVFKTAAEFPNDITCGVNCHPSVRIEEMAFKRSQNELCESIKCPMAVFPAGNDPENCKQGGDFQKILEKKDFGKDCLFVDFPEMEHGWASRGDDTKPNVKRDVDKVLGLSLDFFGKNLK